MTLPYSDPSNPALPSPLFSDITAARADHLRANNAAIFADLAFLDVNNPAIVALTDGSFKTAALANANTYNGRSLFTCTAGVADTPYAGAWRIFGTWNPTELTGRFIAMLDSSLETWEINYSGSVWGTWAQRADANGRVTEAMQSLSNNTTGNVSTTQHGYAPIAPNSKIKFLRGDATYDTITSYASYAITADYTVLDNDTYGIILVNPTDGNVTVTLPTLADNQGRVLKIAVTHKGGDVIIDGEGAETINGLATQRLGRQYDNITIVGGATEWSILSGRQSHSTGWINTNDWTTRHLGDMLITYDNKSGSFIVGEKITESTSGNTWIIVADSGTVLTCKEATGTGYATDNRTLTGAKSGASCLVNHPGSTSKNVDGNILHNFGVNISNGLNIKAYQSSDGAENNAIELINSNSYVTQSGWAAQQVDGNTLKTHTAADGIQYVNDAGSFTVLTTDDIYYKIVVAKNW